MNLTGIDLDAADLDAAVVALSERGHSHSDIAVRCRINRNRVPKVLDAVRARERRAG